MARCMTCQLLAVTFLVTFKLAAPDCRLIINQSLFALQYTHYSIPAAFDADHSFLAAVDFCNSTGATLLTLNNVAEYQDLFVGDDSLFPPGNFLYNGSSATWLGLVNDTSNSEQGEVTWVDQQLRPEFDQPGGAVYRFLQFNFTDFTCADGPSKKCCASLWFFNQRNTRPTVLYYDCGLNVGINFNRTDQAMYWQVVCKAETSPPSIPPSPLTPAYPTSPGFPSPPAYPSLPSFPPSPLPPAYPTAPAFPSPPAYPSLPAFPSPTPPSEPELEPCAPPPPLKGPCGGFGFSHMACYHASKTVYAVNKSKSECIKQFEASPKGTGCLGAIYSWGHDQYGCETFLAYNFNALLCRENYLAYEPNCARIVKNQLNQRSVIAYTHYKTVYKCIGRSDPPAPPCAQLPPA
eukprot:gene25467-11126_t